MMNPSTDESREEVGGSGNNIDSEEPSPSRSVGEHQRPSASAGAAAGGSHAQAGSGGQGVYGREEVSALKGIFSLYDAENTGTIGVKELEGILQKVGHNPGENRVAVQRRAERHFHAAPASHLTTHSSISYSSAARGNADMLRGLQRGGDLSP